MKVGFTGLQPIPRIARRGPAFWPSIPIRGLHVGPRVVPTLCDFPRAAAGKTDDSDRQPFYADPHADPLFDSAHDAEFVWSEREQTWWITYLQNRWAPRLQMSSVEKVT